MGIKDWPADERPREKLLDHGANTLSDAELLAIFLRTGLPGKSAVDLAQELLEDFGSLRALMQADCATFTQGKGLGNARGVPTFAKAHFGHPSPSSQQKLNGTD